MRLLDSFLGPLAVVAAPAVLLVACSVAPASKAVESPAADQAPAPAPAQMHLDEEREERALETVDDAALAFEQAEGALLASLEPGAGSQVGADTLETQPAHPTAQPPPPAGRTVDRCDHACSALGSMRRAAGRLCELTGDGDPRCESVSERVSQATERVRQSCPACQHIGP